MTFPRAPQTQGKHALVTGHRPQKHLCFLQEAAFYELHFSKWARYYEDDLNVSPSSFHRLVSHRLIICSHSHAASLRNTYRKQNPVVPDITSPLDILHKQVVQGAGFYSGHRGPLYIQSCAWGLTSAALSAKHSWYKKKIKLKKIVIQIIFGEWEVQKHDYVVSRENQSISHFSLLFFAKSHLLGFCGWKLGQGKRLNRCFIMNNVLNASKLADRL